jgi:hypothetical protein
MDVRTNSDYFTIQHWLTGFHNRDRVCLLRGTDWVLNGYNSGYVFCVDLRTNSDYFAMRHWLTGFHNRDGVCLMRGTDWVLNIIQVMCFVWISEQIAIISLYSTNWLVCVTKTECVYCAVRAESLYRSQDNLSLWRVNAWCYIRSEFTTIVFSVCVT